MTGSTGRAGGGTAGSTGSAGGASRTEWTSTTRGTGTASSAGGAGRTERTSTIRGTSTAGGGGTAGSIGSAGGASRTEPIGAIGGTGTAFRYREALAAGVSRATIRRAVEDGRITRLARGVYAQGTARLDEIAAAVARLGGDAVASHETAAEVWGLPVLGRPPATVHLTRPRRRTGTDRYPGLTVHHAAVPAAHRTLHRGIPVTTVARTVVDIARARPFRNGVSTADAALRRCRRDEVLAITGDCAGWRGVRRARQVARFADPLAANPLESISRVAFHHYRLPAPLLQAEVGGLAVVDFLWDAYGVVGEADGMSKYVDLEVLHREKHRQEDLERDGLVVVRWNWRDAYHRPDALAHRVGGVLLRRGWRPGETTAWGVGW